MDILEAQKTLWAELKENDDVVGIHNDTKKLVVSVLNEEMADLIPLKYEGYDVSTEITGPYYLQ